MTKLNRVEKKVAEILSSDASTALKISKLQTLALRVFASSPNQLYVIAAYRELQNNG